MISPSWAKFLKEALERMSGASSSLENFSAYCKRLFFFLEKPALTSRGKMECSFEMIKSTSAIPSLA